MNTVKSIVEEWLRKNGFDGLRQRSKTGLAACSCGIDTDCFMVCESPESRCMAGHGGKCKPGQECESCVDQGWHIE